MFCKNCGSAISDQASFCPACGTKVQESAQQARPAPQQPKQAPAADLRSALKLNNDNSALLGYIAAGCSAAAAILWGFIGVSITSFGFKQEASMYEAFLEPNHLTFLTVFIIMALAGSALLLVLPQLGVLNTNILSKKTAIKTSAIVASIVNVFAFFVVHGFKEGLGIDLGDMNAVTILFFILAWIGLAMTLVVYAKSRKSK
ncbi:MAG: zinc ribbon domain-containing protein [Ruminococcaceae bacterium]|nr:zinc ribbon domain-containing protein [Oscillospiraceae bacterium]